jgi:hypothetical protein
VGGKWVDPKKRRNKVRKGREREGEGKGGRSRYRKQMCSILKRKPLWVWELQVILYTLNIRFKVEIPRE